MRTHRGKICALALGLLGACGGGEGGSDDGTGDVATQADVTSAPTGGDDGDVGGSDDSGGPAAGEPVAFSGLRRLTVEEYNATVRDLLGVEAGGELLLPPDPLSPFDNDYRQQSASKALIDSVDLLSGDVAAEALADPVARAALVGCTPAAPDDAACFRAFVAQFGRRALRRTLAPEEVDRYAAFLDHAVEAGDFYVAVDSALRAFLIHPELLYRVEVGEPVGDAGVYRLTSLELAARLSYFLWGSTPPDWLLDAAEGAGLQTPEAVRAAAEQLLADPRARARIARFHALWMGYATLKNGPELNAAMQAETQALIERVLFVERGPWQDLLRSTQTYVSDLLAAHYGLPPPGSATPVWVDYGDSGRRGLLSHGSFLSIGAKFDDTSPTLRGKAIRTRLFCQDITAPADVNVDNPPVAKDPNACKPQRYAEHTAGTCAGCHSLMDPIGFGLENYDVAGRYREHEADRPDCPIAGEGELVGVGSFNGPAELGELMLGADEINRCVISQLYRFAVGRSELDPEDRDLVDALAASAPPGSDLPFAATLLEFVTRDSFRHRREEPADI
jgi:hypothetical protein